MEYTPLGRVRPLHKGEWNSSTAYVALDMVRNGNASYIANKDVPAGIALNNGEYWSLVLDVNALINDVNKNTNDAVARANVAAESANNAAANANRVFDMVDSKVKAITESVSGNPVQIDNADEGSLLKPVLRFEPVQAGSGDPYPAGGGKNLFNYDEWANIGAYNGTAVWENNGVVLSAVNDDCFTSYGANDMKAIAVNPGDIMTLSWEHSGASGTVYVFYNDYPNPLAGCLATNKRLTFAVPENGYFLRFRVGVTAAGSTATYKNIQLELGSTATPYMPHSNIRPIAGRTGAVLTRCGKNLWSGDISAKSATAVYTFQDGTAIFSRNYGSVQGFILSKEKFKKGTYCISFDYRHEGVCDLELRISDEPFADNLSKSTKIDTWYSSENVRYTFSLEKDSFIGFVTNASGVNITLANMQLEFGSTPTAFEPYQGDTFTLNFGQTVYGGTLDWNKGELVVEWGYKALSSADMSSSMKYVPGYVGAWSGDIFDSYALTDYGKKIICNVLPDVAVYGQPKQGIYINSATSIGIQLKGEVFDNYTDTGNDAQNIDLVKAYLDANDVYFAYELATPITIQLAPQQITALAGLNVVYVDADEMTIEYNRSLTSVRDELDINKANRLKASDSGNPVLFYPDEDSLIKPILSFKPIQEGSGDPCPAGGGKNLLGGFTDTSANGVTFKVNADGSVGVNGTSAYQTNINATIHLKPGTYTLSGCPKGGTSSNVEGGYALYTRIANTHYKWDTGEGVTFTLDNEETLDFVIIVRGGTTINATFYPQLEVGSTATVYQPYSNIRHITGRTGANLVRCGKNLMPVLLGGDSNNNGVEWKNNGDGSWTANGTATSAAYISGGGMAFDLGALPAGEYKLDIIASSEETGKLYLRIGSGNGATYLTSNDAQSKDKECTFVADGVTDYYVAIAIKSGATVNDYHIFPVLMDSSHNTFTLDFGQTVKEGTLDWEKGIMMTSDPVRDLDGNEGWSKASSAQNTFYFDYYTSGGQAGNPSLLNDICSHYKTAKTTLYGSENAYYPLSYTGAILRHMFTDSRFNDLASWKAYLAAQKAAGTPVQVTEHSVSHSVKQIMVPSKTQRIIALDGVNTLYSNADDMTVNYSKDLTKAFEEVLSLLATLTVNNT